MGPTPLFDLSATVMVYTRGLAVATTYVPAASHSRDLSQKAPPDPMGRLVMKFGGTSVAGIDRIRNVARHVQREVAAGHEVAVIVSAMSGTTNRLVDWCREAASLHD